MNEFYVGDDNYKQFLDGSFHGGEVRYCGTKPSSTYISTLEGYATAVTIPNVPDNEIVDRIRQQEKDKSSAWAVRHGAGIPILDQDGLSYCHAFSATLTLMIQRVKEGLPQVLLSAGALGGMVTNYHNAGAWIEDDLKKMCDIGIPSTDFVPMQSHTKSDWKEGAIQNAANHRCELWGILGNDIRKHIAASIAGYAIANAFNWQSHALCCTKFVVVTNDKAALQLPGGWGVAPFNDNSWGNWGEDGGAPYYGSKGKPDAGYICLTATASDA